MADFTLAWQPLAIALTGGLLPALLWVWFWNRQDKDCPEPTGLIALSFLAGMIVVFFVLPIQKVINAEIVNISYFINGVANIFGLAAQNQDTIKVTLWAMSEELVKFLVVFFIAYRSQFFDEPMDAIIYIITVALGFSAMENALYILKDLAHEGVLTAFLDSNLRLLGATIVHSAASALVGVAFAIVFDARGIFQFFAAILGVLGATLLHAYFNLTIIDVQGTMGTLAIFSKFWIAMIGIIVLIKIIKRFSSPRVCAVA